jgi:hypothetical protein
VRPLLAVALAAAALVGSTGVRRTGDYTIYVVVADAKGQPVLGLPASAFFVELNGKPVEIASAGPASEPASILLLTDRLGQTADYRPADLRKALRSFVEVSSDGRSKRNSR